MPYQISVTEACVDDDSKRSNDVISNQLHLKLKVYNRNQSNFTFKVAFRDPQNDNIGITDPIQTPASRVLQEKQITIQLNQEINFTNPADTYHIAILGITDQNLMFNIHLATLKLTINGS